MRIRGLLLIVLVGVALAGSAQAAETWCLNNQFLCEESSSGGAAATCAEGIKYPSQQECNDNRKWCLKGSGDNQSCFISHPTVGTCEAPAKEFSSEEDCDAAISAGNGSEPSGEKKWCITVNGCEQILASTCATSYDSPEACKAKLDSIAEEKASQDKVKPVTGAKGNTVELINPIGGKEGTPLDRQGVTNLYKITGRIISSALGILGSLALLVFIYGGFQWVTAAGNSDKISSGASAMTWAVIGICIIFSSYAIINLIFSTLIDKTIERPAEIGDVTGESSCYCFADGEKEKSRVKKYEGQEQACRAITGSTKGESDFGGTVTNCEWKAPVAKPIE